VNLVLAHWFLSLSRPRKIQLSRLSHGHEFRLRKGCIAQGINERCSIYISIALKFKDIFWTLFNKSFDPEISTYFGSGVRATRFMNWHPARLGMTASVEILEPGEQALY
jgi:hypothetical protein